MYLVLLLLPLLSFLGCIFFGRWLGETGCKIYGTSCLIFGCLVTYVISYDVLVNESNVCYHLIEWYNVGLWSNTITLLFDEIVCSMLVLVFTVSSLVHLYSTSYMNGDPHLPRFMSYLSLFTFFMLVLITSQNLVQLFIGWEGVGLCSYLLINFWFTRIQANKAAIKAMILNKIGDIGVLLSMVGLWVCIGTWDYSSLFPIVSSLPSVLGLNVINTLLLVGVVGKSAQVGLHTWLPDAMEGPTPVSALIHAATMVTAGVFLIIRLSPLFEQTPSVLWIIILLGSITAFFSATIGLTQNDLKKVIAYSTCSQLGYMVLICGFSYYSLSLFHLVNHGFFKALLFLSAGSIIHAIKNEQDFRKIGNLKYYLPVSYVSIMVGSLSLMGLPFLTGFYSKDLIIEITYGSYWHSFSFLLALIAASLTAFYSFRLIYRTFISDFQGNKDSFENIHEGPWNLVVPLLILILFSIGIGYLTQFIVLKDQILIFISNNVKFSPLNLSLVGAILALMLGYWTKLRFNFIQLYVYHCFYSLTISAWYIDRLWTTYLTLPMLRFGFSKSYILIDNQLLENWGPLLTYGSSTAMTNKITKFHSGNLSNYILYVIVFIVFLYLNL